MLLRWSHYAVWVSSKRRSSVSLCLMRCLMNMLYSPTNSHVPLSRGFCAHLCLSLCISCHVHVDKLCKDRRAALAKAEAAAAAGFWIRIIPRSMRAGWPAGPVLSLAVVLMFLDRLGVPSRSLSLVSERGISPWEKPIGRAGICARLGHQIWRMRANDRGMDK